MKFWRAVLVLGLGILMACQRVPVPNDQLQHDQLQHDQLQHDQLQQRVMLAAQQAASHPNHVLGLNIMVLPDGRTKVVVQLDSSQQDNKKIGDAVAQALFGKRNNIVLELVQPDATQTLALVCPGAPFDTTVRTRPKPNRIVGANITLNPGHGWTRNDAGMWGLQRDAPRPSDGVNYPVFLQEDYNNLETAIVVQAALGEKGVIVSSTRNLDKAAGVGASGKPRWQEAAKHHLENIALPASVWDSEREVKDKDCQIDKDIRARPFYANNLGVDALIGLHTNAITTGWQSARGTRAYYSTENAMPGTPATQQPESLALAQAMAKTVVAAIRKARPDLNWPDAQVIGSREYGETRFAHMPAVIIETGFHTHPIDGPALTESSVRQAIALGIREGIKNWLGDTTDDGGIVITPTPTFPDAPDLIAPGSPSTLVVDVLTPVVFSWSGVSGATRYGLYISKYPYGEANIVYRNEQIAATSTSLSLPAIDFRFATETRYRWNMIAFNGPSDGNKGKFSTALIFSLTETLPVPSAPSSLVVTMSSLGRMLLVWQEVAAADNYSFTAIFDAQNATVAGVAKANKSGLNAAVVTLSPDPSATSAQNKTVCFAVVAKNISGQSIPSNQECVVYRYYQNGLQVLGLGSQTQLKLIYPK